MTERLRQILKRYWGYDDFRPLQLETIESVCAGRDTLVLMPTGGGKSVIYQVPGLALDGVCIVVTPLIALMKDQIDQLRRRRILAESIHSGMQPRDIDRILDNCVYGDVKFLYIAPERIDSELFRTRFAKMRVSLLAVTYEGVLRVTDAALFRRTLTEGIGRGKAYGMGLLTVMRAPEGGA